MEFDLKNETGYTETRPCLQDQIYRVIRDWDSLDARLRRSEIVGQVEQGLLYRRITLCQNILESHGQTPEGGWATISAHDFPGKLRHQLLAAAAKLHGKEPGLSELEAADDSGSKPNAKRAADQTPHRILANRLIDAVNLRALEKNQVVKEAGLAFDQGTMRLYEQDLSHLVASAFRTRPRLALENQQLNDLVEQGPTTPDDILKIAEYICHLYEAD